MMKNWLVVLFVILFVSCRSGKETNHITVVGYNVENLFDTVDDPHKNDNEFLPDSKKEWTPERYQKKLNDIARVLSDINPEDMPEIIGLAEIENQKVLEDLVKTEALAPGNYKIAHRESPDKRGIDVALLYRPDEFKLYGYEAIPVDPGFATRDILHVWGRFKREKFHFFVNHWPSRIGGLAKSEPARIVAAESLKKAVDPVLAEDPEAHIVIMGDMNDEPFNKSLRSVLGAASPESDSTLVNLMMPLSEAGKGTYNYRGNWNMLDNLVVSSNLLDQKGFRVTPPTGFIFHESWMEYTGKKGEISPNRTYGGPNYYGGVSDHFPVYFELQR
jgi:predicted extracellular nuclease